MIEFIERVFFNPKKIDYIVIIALLPLSFIYGLINFFKVVFATKKDFGIKIISIGNLIVGGSGKTPFAIELINHFKDKKIAYISRGYGRVSKGLIVVKDKNILTTTKQSGDEAMLVAKQTNALVIVSEDRKKAINLAKQRGVDFIILDDAFSKTYIKKFDILLESQEIKNIFPLPSGPFREFWFAKKRANLIAKEGIDFKRVVELENLKDKMLLVTAISNPKRLDKFLPKDKIVGRYYLKDHSYFNEDDIKEKMQQLKAKSIIVTQKDLVKMEHFSLEISIIKLKLDINSDIFLQIEDFLKE